MESGRSSPLGGHCSGPGTLIDTQRPDDAFIAGLNSSIELDRDGRGRENKVADRWRLPLLRPPPRDFYEPLRSPGKSFILIWVKIIIFLRFFFASLSPMA